jgi:hypothetical protein
MEAVFAQLPTWGLLVVAIVFVVVKYVAPLINKGPAHPPSSSNTNGHGHSTQRSSPMIPAMSTSRDAVLFENIQSISDQVHANAQVSARFEAALERNLELDRQQFDLLRAMAGQLQADSRAIQQITETLQGMQAAMKVMASTQETILRRVLEDTGRFQLPNQRG